MSLEIIINILLLTASFCIMCMHKIICVIQVELLDQSFLIDPQYIHSDADFETSLYSLPLASCDKSYSHAVLCKSRAGCARHLPRCNLQLLHMLTQVLSSSKLTLIMPTPARCFDGHAGLWKWRWFVVPEAHVRQGLDFDTLLISVCHAVPHSGTGAGLMFLPCHLPLSAGWRACLPSQGIPPSLASLLHLREGVFSPFLFLWAAKIVPLYNFKDPKNFPQILLCFLRASCQFLLLQEILYFFEILGRWNQHVPHSYSAKTMSPPIFH